MVTKQISLHYIQNILKNTFESFLKKDAIGDVNLKSAFQIYNISKLFCLIIGFSLMAQSSFAAVPGAPTSVTATAGNTQVRVAFIAPASDGGSPITSYTVKSSPGSFTNTGTVSPIIVSGLTNGTSYTFTVVATNADGNSVSSSASAAVIPATVPDAPSNVSSVADDSQAIVSFTASANNGGSAITGYRAIANPGNISKTGTSSPIYLTGLTNGTSYTITVVATNLKGNSVACAAPLAVVPMSYRILTNPNAKLLSIYQPAKTDLHMLTSVDSMHYVPGTDKFAIFKKNGLTYTYSRLVIDSIVMADGSGWSDSLKVALDVTRFGVVGDGTSDNNTNLNNAISQARSIGANLYFPNGTYYFSNSLSAQNVRFIGQNRTNTIIKKTSISGGMDLDGADNITFQDVSIGDNGTSLTRTFKNCVFNTALNVTESFIQFYTGVSTSGADNKFIDCDFKFPTIWIGLYITKYNSVLIQNCLFNGVHATHNIRLENPAKIDAPVSIVNNSIFGGTTGIFIAPSQNISMVGGLIQGNHLFAQLEESIAFDGIGNDPSMMPVIANGKIASAGNDTNGRLIVSLNSMTNSYGSAATVSARTTWKNYYFLFGTGTGLDGKYVKIYDYNATDNTVTVDTIITASNLNLNGMYGVESGFFNWTIRRNTVTGTLGANYTYGTALSIYLNVFGMLVEDNVVTNSAHGINLAGGTMMNNSQTYAYNNIVRNNTFTDCDRFGVGSPSAYAVVSFASYYSSLLQFNNKFINNTINGGRVYFANQRNFVETGNTYNNVTRLAVDVQ